MRSKKRKSAANSEPDRQPRKIVKRDTSRDALINLPNEIIESIASWLPNGAFHNLCLVNRFFFTLLERRLYARDAAREYSESLLWSAIHNMPATAQKAISAGAKINASKPKHPATAQFYWNGIDYVGGGHLSGSRACVPLPHCEQSPLFIASYQGHLQVAKTLLRHGAGPSWNTPWGHSMTPASAAAAKGHLEILKHMHDLGFALKNDRCYHGTLLHAAVSHGRAKVVEFLVKTAGLDIGEQNSDGQTALELSVSRQSVTIVRFLLKLTPAKDISITRALSQIIENYTPGYTEIILDSNKIDWSHTTRFGDTLIAQAIQQDKPHFLHLLLQKKELDPGLPTASGLTPLMLARRSPGYRGACLEMLIDSEKVSREAKAAVGNAIFFEVIRRTDCDTLLKKLLAENLAGDNHVAHFHSAAEHGRQRLVSLLVNDYSVPVDSNMPNGQTAIQAAFLRKDAETTKCLCQLGASPVLGGTDPLPMLHHAARHGTVPMIRTLLGSEVDPDKIINGTKQTALHFACASGNLDRITALLDYGADPMICDIEGYTAYHFAVRTGKEKLIKWLLSGRRHPDPLLQNGPTLLHEACRAGNAPVVKLLLKRKCDLEARTSRGETALHLAVAQGHSSIIQLLLDRGADASAKAKDGSTPKSLGARSERLDVRAVLTKDIEQEGGTESVNGPSDLSRTSRSK